jgi:TP901 family phage tail tape measure protein
MSNDLKLRVLFDMIDGATKPLKNIVSGNKELAKSLKESRDNLKELGKTQQDIANFRELRTGLRGSSTELQAAQARVNALAAAMNASGPPTKAMVREFDKAKQSASQLKDAHEKQELQVQQLRTRLAGAGVDTRNLVQHERQLRTDMNATSAAIDSQKAKLTDLAARERKLADARAKMQATQATAGKMAIAGGTMLAGGAALNAARAVPITAYAKAEESATGLQVALMRAGGIVPPEFEKINALAMKLGDRLPGTTSDFQDMMTMLNRQGISATAILGGMGEATAYLAVQLKKAPSEAAEFAAKMQDATGTTEKDMMGLMDIIQRTFYLGVDDNNMLQAFAKLAPAMDILKTKGLAATKALAPLLVMADQEGMKGEAAGNAYRKVFQMSMDKKKIDKANAELKPGQKLEFTDGKGEFGGFDNMLKQLDKLKETNGVTTQKRLSVLKTVFGDDAETLQVIGILMKKGADGYAEVQDKMAAQASLQERVNKQLGTLKNMWDAATGTFTNGMVAFGESIAPELKATVEWLGDMSQKMGAWARENPRLAGFLMKTIGVIAMLLTVAGGLTLMLASILGPMAALKFSIATLGLQGGMLARVLGMAGGALRLVGQAVLFLGRALLMNPIGLAISAIALAAFLIYQYWGPITGFFGNLWNQVRAIFASSMTWFASLPSQFLAFGTNIVTGLINGITGGIGAVRDAITNVASSTVGVFKETLGIKSPSRVFADLGGFISQGAALGMESEQGKVAKAAIGLATAAVTAFSPPAMAQAAQIGAAISQAAGMPIISSQVPIDSRAPVMSPQAAAAPAGGGGASYSININAAPGMDPAAIARAVSAELDRRERAKQSRVGSRLTD